VGTLYYGSQRQSATFDDRALAHLQAVMMGKLRRGEGFGFSWGKTAEQGSGRSTIWVHPGVELHFEYEDAARPNLNRAWLEALTRQANTAVGLSLVDEPDADSATS